MKIAIAGSGYVGLVSGACFSDMGIDVVCIDRDEEKVGKLKQGIIPIYEPGLEEIVVRNQGAGRLAFDTSLAAHIDEVEVVFCAVGTPPRRGGETDLSQVEEVAREVGRHMKKYLLFATKSTVPVGTAEKVERIIREELERRGVDTDFDVASNPEFLKEGDAVNDFMKPGRVVVGVGSKRARSLMEKLYYPFMRNNYRMIFTDIRSAEMIKYAANAMLATRISFMNDIANLCELTGADVNMVRKGIGSDPRIGSKFLYPGCGYGGSCFPKDIRSLISTAGQAGYDMAVLKAVDSVNERQKSVPFEKLKKHFGGDLAGKSVAIWGLSFKPETDDIREAPSMTTISLLLGAGASVRAYDPAAMKRVREELGDRISYCADKYDALQGAEALLVMTEWKEFRIIDWALVKKRMTTPLVIDGRNIYDPEELHRHKIRYEYIGAAAILP